MSNLSSPAALLSPPARRLRSNRLLDARLLAGLALMLASVVLGARIFAGASRTVLIWQAAVNLVPGEALTQAMVQPVRVDLGAAQRYYVSASQPVPGGYLISRPVGRDELLPYAALQPAGAAAGLRIVAVPVLVGHFDPAVGPGDVVDVYATARQPGGGAAAGPSRLVLATVSVTGRSGGSTAFGGGGSAVTVLIAVPEADVPALVAAVESADIDLVDVPAGGGSS